MRYEHRTWRPHVAAVVMLAGVVVLPSAPAGATFRGENGRIAFRRFLNEERTWAAVFTIEPYGSDERQITSPPQGFVDRNPDVSPDGQRITFEREGVDCGGRIFDEICVVGSDGTNLTR